MLDDRRCAVWKTGPLVRVELFSDAVFAISITLLIIDIKLPEATSVAKLSDSLRELWPHYIAYFLSFAIVAMQWVDHHDIFAHVERCSKGLFWMNFVFLSCIAFLPFPTAVLGRFPNERASVVFYSAVITFTVLVKICLWTGGLCFSTILTMLACFWPVVALSLWAIFGIVSIAVRSREPRQYLASGTTGASSSAKTNE